MEKSPQANHQADRCCEVEGSDPLSWGLQAEGDVVEGAILGLATEGEATGAEGDSAEAQAKAGDFDIVAASEWPGIAKERVLLSPAQCRTAWRQFSSDSSVLVQQAISAQVWMEQTRTTYKLLI